ncbi:MAG: glycosyltransferase family 4 protein [Candidatus Hydrogenedentes bacterium]|nr:glycosyltransferase family 4 protein [Candidatus Hydrogenedentota bacterium]
MNILVLTVDYPPIEGGIGTVALQLSRELAAMGHRVTVIAPYFPEMESFDRNEPVEVLRFRGYGFGWLRFFPLLIASRKHVRQSDVVFAINISYGGIIAWLTRRPYVTFGYAYEFLKFRKNPVLSRLLRRVYLRSRLVVAISSFTCQKLQEFGIPSSHIETILPGAPPARELSKDERAAIETKYELDTKHVILSVGRFVRRKGHDILVKALPYVLEEFPDAVMVLVGRGPRMELTAQLAEELGVADHVRMTGRIPQAELDALYRICELFALPTGEDEAGQVEGFGLVFSEAHAYGKPVVAGRSGGVTDAVQDGETGILVEVVEPKVLADAILSLLRDPEYAKRLGMNGRRRVEEELNWTRFTQKVLQAIEARG